MALPFDTEVRAGVGVVVATVVGGEYPSNVVASLTVLESRGLVRVALTLVAVTLTVEGVVEAAVHRGVETRCCFYGRRSRG